MFGAIFAVVELEPVLSVEALLAIALAIEGDGRAEVVYNDELQLRVYRGTDGMVIFNACSTSGTL